MASFHTISEELRLSTDSQTLTRTFSFVREGSDTVPREEVFAIINLTDRPSGGEDLIRTVFQTLKEICFIDQKQDPYERFETALKEVNAVIAEARESLPNKNLGPINAVIGLLSDKEMHLTQSGEAEAYLVRKGALTTITEGLAGEETAVDTFINIASGKVESRDKLILSNERLLRYVTKNELTKIFSAHKEIGQALEELDEIIVLEGAQTTGVLAVDFVTEAIATRARAEETPGSKGTVALNKARKTVTGALSWMRDRIPEGVSMPGNKKLKLDRNYIILGFLLIVILILLSVSWSIGGKRNSVKIEEVRTALESVQTNIDLAKVRQAVDKIGAKQLLTEAEQTAKDLVQSGLALEEANNKIAEIKQLQDEIDDIRRFSDLKPLVDISRSKSDVSLLGVADVRGSKIAYDAHSAYVTLLDSVNETSTIDATSTIRVGEYFVDRDAIIFTTVDGKIIEWRDGTATSMDTKDDTWKSSVELGTYSSFLYLLDPTNNQIWKYQRQGAGYSTATAYNQNADLTKAVSLAVDGDLWVLNNDSDGDMSNDITRLRKGEKKNLTIRDLPTDVWQNPKKIYTTENLKNLYVLDQNAKRVLRFYKNPAEAGTESRDLQYDTQYLFEGIKEIRDFWIDDAEQKIYLIDGQKIYEATI